MEKMDGLILLGNHQSQIINLHSSVKEVLFCVTILLTDIVD